MCLFHPYLLQISDIASCPVGRRQGDWVAWRSLEKVSRGWRVSSFCYRSHPSTLPGLSVLAKLPSQLRSYSLWGFLDACPSTLPFSQNIFCEIWNTSKRRELQREREDGLMQKLILYRQKAEPRAIFEVSPTMHTDLPDETKPSHQIRLWRYLRLKLGCSTPTYLLNISGSIVELIFFSFPFLEILFWLLENCSRNWFPFTYFLCKYLLLGRSRKNSSSLQVMCRKDKIFIKCILDKPFKHK